jgi:hypothetical protein
MGFRNDDVDRNSDSERGHRLMDSIREIRSNEGSSDFTRVVTQGLHGQGNADYPPQGHDYPKA